MNNRASLPLAEAHNRCCLGRTALASDEAETYAHLFKVLADPARLQLLSHIAAEGCTPLSVNELTTLSGLSQPTVSHHLKKMVEAGLLEKHRTGRSVTHSVQPEIFQQLRSVLNIE